MPTNVELELIVESDSRQTTGSLVDPVVYANANRKIGPGNSLWLTDEISYGALIGTSLGGGGVTPTQAKIIIPLTDPDNINVFVVVTRDRLPSVTTIGSYFAYVFAEQAGVLWFGSTRPNETIDVDDYPVIASKFSSATIRVNRLMVGTFKWYGTDILLESCDDGASLFSEGIDEVFSGEYNF